MSEGKILSKIERKLADMGSGKLTWTADIAFTLFTLLFLGAYHHEYLYKIQDSSLFLSNEVFYGEMMQFSAGLLIYIGRYLTQLLHYPVLGAMMLAAGHLSIVRATRAIRDSKALAFTDYLPSALLLLAQTTVGYAVYSNFDSSLPVTAELGLIIALLLAKAQMSAQERWGKTASAVIFFIIIASTYAIGIFALLAMVVPGMKKAESDRKQGTMTIGTALAVYLIIVYITSTHVLNEPYTRTLFAPLPDPYFTEPFFYTLAAIAGALIATSKTITEKAKGLSQTAQLGVALALAVATCVFTNRDENYRTEIKLQRLTDEHKWGELIEDANKLEHPTAVAAQYRFTALHQTGRAWNELFDYPCRFDTIKCKYRCATGNIYTADIFFYGSAPNEGYRKAMEEWCSKERDFRKLRFFATYALYRDEAELAKRYINLLKQSTFQKKWAEKHEKYIGNHALFLQENPTMQRIADYEVKENHNSYSCDLQRVYGMHVKMTREQWQYRLLLDLFYKDMPQFGNDLIGVNYAFGNNLPNYLQEAILIKAMQARDNRIAQNFAFNREVVAQTQNFFLRFGPYIKDKGKGAEMLKDRKGSYSYHYACEDLFRYQKLQR